MSKRRDPVVIDVKPEELHREPALRAAPPVSAPHPPHLPRTAREVRELHRLGRAAQRPDFWIGLIIRNLWRG